MTVRHASWIYALEESSASETVASIISDMIALLPADDALWRDLTTRYQADIFCDLGSEQGMCCLDLSPDLMRELSSRYLTVNI
ncbi:DUF4279 domain-containing protein, partial [Streptococcus pseudopneumoniae]|uniref:DUF4279 domain-containing protein n=1 Tax=Streptococcus pseudopneumoniae TaxID=257758 RepID=UPI003BAA7221